MREMTTPNGRNDYNKSAETLAETLESWSVGGYNGNIGFCSPSRIDGIPNLLKVSDSVWAGASVGNGDNSKLLWGDCGERVGRFSSTLIILVCAL